jgi:N-acetylglutamate synthase-like GNAT family acetyltransferase
MLIRIAEEHDLDALAVHDRRIPKEALGRSIAAGLVLTAHEENRLAGCLRWGLFLDEIPLISQIMVLEDHRGRGAGRALVENWESHMQEAGYDQVMAIAKAAECDQHFFRHLGYADAGAIALPGGPQALLLKKELPIV